LFGFDFGGGKKRFEGISVKFTKEGGFKGEIFRVFRPGN